MVEEDNSVRWRMIEGRKALGWIAGGEKEGVLIGTHPMTVV